MCVWLKFVLAFALLLLGIYIEDNMRGTGLLVGLSILFIGCIIETILKIYGHESYFLKGWGITFTFIFLCGLGYGVHIEENEEGIFEVHSPFLKRVIDKGQRKEILKLRTFYSRYYQDYSVESEEFVLLHKHLGDSSFISIYDKRKIMDLPDTCFTIEEVNGGHGMIQYIKCRGKAYFMRGSFTGDKYHPYILDITPESNI